MTARTTRPVAVAVTVLTVLVVTADLILRQVFADASGSADGLTLVPMVLALAGVGGLVAFRRGDNVYGWLLAGVGLAWALNSLFIDYAALSVARGSKGGLVAAVAAVAAGSIAWGTFVTFVLLLYPTGTLPSRRWRWVGGTAAAGVAFMTVGLCWTAVETGTAGVVAQMRAGVPVSESGIPAILNGIGHTGVFFGLLAGAASLFVRRRRADKVRRLQLKWFAFGGAVVAVSILVVPIVGGPSWVEIVAVTFMPVVIGIAILRWHLYDIDRIVSRTLAYALLTLLLVGIYLGAVTTLTSLTATVTGESPAAVAAATLLAAAAFQPARRRIQSLVDRRFNRARYDGRRTVEAFASSLRQEVDLTDVQHHLVTTVGGVLQPATIRVWLAPGQGGH